VNIRRGAGTRTDGVDQTHTPACFAFARGGLEVLYL